MCESLLDQINAFFGMNSKKGSTTSITMHPNCSSAPSEAGLVALTVGGNVAKQHDFPAADLQ